jgi:Amt family ammonium transporter
VPCRFPQATSRDARILLAEDNEVNQDVAVQMLTKAGYQCDVVANGKQAVEALRSARYDAILMDCHMPEMDGLEATRSIRESEQRGEIAGPGKIPIIALTANAMASDRQRCLEAGMSDYLSKPLNPMELVETIEACLRQLNEPAAAVEEGCPGNSPDPSLPNGASLAAAGAASATILHLDALLARCMGDSAVAERILAKFQQRVPDDLVQIEESVRAGEAERVASLAHALKGAAANLSAAAMGEVAARLETAGHNADLDGARARLVQLRSEWERFLQQLPAILAAAGMSHPPQDDVPAPAPGDSRCVS